MLAFIALAISSSGSSSDNGPITDQSSAPSQPQQPAGLTNYQKNLILSKFCLSQMNGSELQARDCPLNYYVTDQGQVMPR